jgi:hypothetical protein
MLEKIHEPKPWMESLDKQPEQWNMNMKLPHGM